MRFVAVPAAVLVAGFACAHAAPPDPARARQPGRVESAPSGRAPEPVWLRALDARVASGAERVVAVGAVRGTLEGWAAAIMGDELRTAASDRMASHGFTAVPLEVTDARGRSRRGAADCANTGCELDRARSLGVELLVVAEVARLDGQDVVVVRLFDAVTGELLATSRFSASTTAELLERTYAAGDALFR